MPHRPKPFPSSPSLFECQITILTESSIKSLEGLFYLEDKTKRKKKLMSLKEIKLMYDRKNNYIE